MAENPEVSRRGPMSGRSVRLGLAIILVSVIVSVAAAAFGLATTVTVSHTDAVITTSAVRTM